MDRKMEKIFHKRKLVAIKINGMRAGTTALTSDAEPLQILTQKRAKGTRILPHYHRPTSRTTKQLQECLVVLKGRLRISLYASSQKPFKKVTVGAGDAFVTLLGGHAVEFLEDSEILEIKNGPYAEDRVDL